MTSLIEQEYIESLTEKEKKGYEIAKDHLGKLFRLDQSAGFIHWLNAKEAEKEKEKEQTTTKELSLSSSS